MKDYEQQLSEEYGTSEEWALINTVTGEYKAIINGTVMHLPKLHKRDNKNNICEKFQPKEQFIKMYKYAARKLQKELSYKEYSIFSIMCTYLRMYDCVLCDDETHSVLSIKDLSKLLDIDYDNLRKIINVFEKKEMLKIIKMDNEGSELRGINAIVINPFLFFNGEYITVDIKKYFIDSIWNKLQP